MSSQSIKLSSRASALKPSPTLAMAAKARDLAQKGHNVISLTIGEPDWATFESASRAGIQAIERGFTKYTASAGISELRQAISSQVKSELKLDYKLDEIIVGSGAKFILYTLLQMLLNSGDEVIIPSPYWVSYPTMVELAGGIPRFISCGSESHFKMTAESLEKAITPRTKVLMFSSPSNPTGISYSKSDLKKLGEVLKKYPDILVISDDIYDKLVFSTSPHNVKMSSGLERAPHILDEYPEMRDRVVIVNGASKTFSMTGWRVGWALGPAELMKACADFLSQSTSNVTSISQKAVLAALTAGPDEVKSAVQKLERKRDFYLQKSKDFKFFKVIPPDGAFYFWIDVKHFFGKSVRGFSIGCSKDIADILLESYYLALVPGSDFGCEGYIRLSIAASEKDLTEAWARLIQFEKDLIGG